MQRIDDVGVQAFVKQKSKNVVAVVSGSLKPYFYFISWTDAAANSLQQCVKALCIVLNGEYIRQDFASELRMKQSCLSLATSIPTQIIMVPPVCLFDAGSTGHFTLVTLFYINRLALSN